MNARHGKIARLPLAIREELNRRLQNGELSPVLLPWLNQLPEVQSILTASFAGQPISRQNLSEWRQGGYRDWLKLQERQLLIRRIAEEGTTLKQQEGTEDLFENFARIAVTELFADLDTLDEFHGDERSKRLRNLTRELARLQREYNRSREVELSWEKWNDQFEDATEDEENPTSKDPAEAFRCADPQTAGSNQNLVANSQTAGLSPNLVTNSRVPKFHPLPTGEGRGEGDRNINNAPQTTSLPDLPVKVDQTASNEYLEPWQRREAELDKLRTYLPRQIHQRRCEHHCICPTCHTQDSPYSHSEALRDQTEAQSKGIQAFWRGNVMINITYLDCNCPCNCHQINSLNESKLTTHSICAL